MSTGDRDAFIRGLFATIDRKDTEGFLGYLTDDASIRFGSAPAVDGREGIRALIDGFFGSIRSVAHTLDFTASLSGRVICEGTVTYGRNDGSSVTLPFVDVLDLADEAAEPPLIARYKVYIDIAPLFAGSG